MKEIDGAIPHPKKRQPSLGRIFWVRGHRGQHEDCPECEYVKQDLDFGYPVDDDSKWSEVVE